MHTSRLREKILAAGLSQHIMAKKWFLCLAKTLEKPSILHAIQNLICFNCSDVESVPRGKKMKTLISFILTGLYVTKQSAANQLHNIRLRC